MRKELVAAISNLTSDLYELGNKSVELIEPPDITPKDAAYTYHPGGLYEVGTVIPWLNNAVWCGNARSFADYCFENGEPELVRNSAGVRLTGGKWLDGYVPVNEVVARHDEMPSQVRPRNTDGGPAFPFPRN